MKSCQSGENECTECTSGNTKRGHQSTFTSKTQHKEKRCLEKRKVMIAGSGDQRRIPSVVVVDHPKSKEKSATKITNHDNLLSSPSSVEKKDTTIKGKVSPGSGRLLPYVPKRYVIPRVPAGLSSPSASSSSATTAKRIVKEVSFEDDDLDDGTDINCPPPRLDTFDETDEYVNEESGVENNQDTNGDVTDVSGVVSDVDISLPVILRDYLGPAPTTATDVQRKREDVISPPQTDDIARQLYADLDMGPLNKEFDPLTSSISDTGHRININADGGISDDVANVDVLSTQADGIDNWETQFSTMLDANNEKAYQTHGDRRITSDITSTIDTYGTYRRGNTVARKMRNNTYHKLPKYIDDSSIIPFQHPETNLDSRKLELDRLSGNHYGQSFYDDEFLTENEKQRLSYLRSIGTTSRGFNGHASFNRRTSDSLIDTSYHHSNVYVNGRGILTPSLDGTSLNSNGDALNGIKDVLPPVTSLQPVELSSTERDPQFDRSLDAQRMILDQEGDPLNETNAFSMVSNEDSSNIPLPSFDGVSCKYKIQQPVFMVTLLLRSFQYFTIHAILVTNRYHNFSLFT